MKEKPFFLILAGPNGAGKTTCAMTLLPDILHIKHFVNADLIAKGLSPFDPSLADLKASRLMVEEMNRLRAARESFAIETTLASKSIAKFVSESQIGGYETALAFVALDMPETAISRVALRVAMGGHDIPKSTIRRRFYRGLNNLFHVYMPLVDHWTIFDNSGAKERIVADKMQQPCVTIYDNEFFRQMERMSQHVE